MTIKPKFLIDTETGMSNLNIFVDNILITVYSYKNDKVKLSERIDPVTTNLNVIKENILSIKKWIEYVRENLFPMTLPKKTYEQKMKKKPMEMIATFERGNLITDASFDSQTQLITFQPRDEITIGFSDFIGWYDFLFILYRECVLF